jgi:hypothetical protein
MFNYETMRDRANSSLSWLPSDSEDNWVPIINGTNIANYSKTDINYSFNSYGFRCDDFHLTSDCPVIFMGCSYTEGIGLPMEVVWTNHIINNIRDKFPNKKIPFWSLAVGASGTDFQSDLLSQYHQLLKPKHIIYFYPTIYRRELVTDYAPPMHWGPWQYVGDKQYSDPANESAAKLFTQHKFAMHQTMRSFSIISAIAEIHNSKVTVFLQSQEVRQNMPFFAYLRARFTNIYFIEFFPAASDEFTCPSWVRKHPPLARDNAHPGAVWQWKVYSSVWKNIHLDFT